MRLKAFLYVVLSSFVSFACAQEGGEGSEPVRGSELTAADSALIEEGGKIAVTERDYENMQVEMADELRANGVIYFVALVCTLLAVGVVGYLFAIDRKVKKLEAQADALAERAGKKTVEIGQEPAKPDGSGKRILSVTALIVFSVASVFMTGFSTYQPDASLNGQFSIYGLLQSDGKYYAVAAVVLLVAAGFAVYLMSADRWLEKAERLAERLRR